MNDTKINILIIENDQETISLFQNLFQEKYFSVDITENIDQAFELYKTINYQLIISEIFLEQLLTAKFIKFVNNYDSKPIPILLINSHYSDEYKINIITKNKSIKAAISKPIINEELNTSLENIQFLNKYNITFINDKFKVVAKQKLVEDLTDKLEDINIRDEKGRSPLMIFAEKNNLEKVKLLIQGKAQTELKCKKGRTVLHYAASTNNVELVKYLIEQGCKITSRDGQNATPLYYSILSKSNDVLTELLKQGSRVKMQVKGKSYLMVAASKNNLKAIKLLLSAGADINVKDNKGYNVLQQAKMKKQIGVLKIIQAFKMMADNKKKAA